MRVSIGGFLEASKRLIRPREEKPAFYVVGARLQTLREAVDHRNDLGVRDLVRIACIRCGAGCLLRGWIAEPRVKNHGGGRDQHQQRRGGDPCLALHAAVGHDAAGRCQFFA